MSIPSCVLAVSLLAGAPASPEPKGGEAQELFYPTRLVVDVSKLTDVQEAPYADRTKRRLEHDLQPVLQDEYRLQLVSEPQADAAEVIIRLVFVDYMESRYTVTIEVKRPDGETEEPIVFPCDGCLDKNLVENIVPRLPEVVARLYKAPPEADEPPSEAAPAETSTPEGDDEGEQPDPVVKPRRGVMIAGYTAIGVGAGLLAGGVVVLTRPPKTDSAMPDRATDLQPLGIGLAVGGGVALATGVVLVAVEATRCKRRGSCANEKPSPSTSLFPLLDPTTAGIGILRHF